MDSNEIRENEIEENLEIQKMKLENQAYQAAGENKVVAREKIQLQKEKNVANKKGKKIKKSFKKQYGKDADKVFYASANKGTLKGVIKKLRRGSTGFSDHLNLAVKEHVLRQHMVAEQEETVRFYN